MSSSSVSSNQKKKLLDEQNLKILRELAALLPNKQCFDCHQRGPTYVNMTIGSFVCTSCSGLLRGLNNPPHRVKSISMAVFTVEEIEFLKSRGNEYCRRVWIGRYDRSSSGRSPFEDGVSSSKDETQMKDHLVLKYEKKRWYMNPSEAFANGPPPTQQLASSSSSTNNNNSSNSSQHQQHTAAGIIKAPHPPPAAPVASNAAKQQQQHQSNQDLLSSRNLAAPPVPSSSVDVLFDPFGSSAPPPSNGHPFFQQHHYHQNQNQTPTIQNLPDVPKSATVPSGFLAAAAASTSQQQLRPVSVQQQQQQPQQKQQAGGGDKYSALAELDDLFRSSSPVDAAIGAGAAADRKQPASGVSGGGFSTTTAPNQFFPYQHQQQPVVVSANPFTTPSGTAQHRLSHQSTPASSSIMNAGAPAGGFPFFGVAPTGQGQPGYGPVQQQQQFVQSPPAASTIMNPFAAPPQAHPRQTTNTAASWNPFL